MSKRLDRRTFLKYGTAAMSVLGVNCAIPFPAWALNGDLNDLSDNNSKNFYDLKIAYQDLAIDGQLGRATGINGTVPGPLLRFKEGEEVNLNVTNLLQENSSLHWHGLLVPFPMDGVPGVNFKGIVPGDTYHYKFKLKQAGTYWYHSHSHFQEQTGAYGPIIIDPIRPDPFSYDREYVIVLSDWSFEDPDTIFRNINLMGDYYNFQRRTLFDFFEDSYENGLLPTMRERAAWGRMRMSPVDILDVTGATYTYLINGHSPQMNWSGLFSGGETVRLRFINASAMTVFDVRIPEMNMEIVQADGKNVKPVEVHEFRIGVAEIYDVLVRPKEEKAYTIFAESENRSGFARATLTPEIGLEACIPKERKRPVRKLEDIGMGGMDSSLFGGGMDKMMMGKKMNGEMNDKSNDSNKPDKDNTNVAMVIMNPKNRLSEPGLGLGKDGWKVLTYTDLESAELQIYSEIVDREMTINITANMQRYMFSFDGKKYTEHEGPYLFRYMERLRLYLVNHTMMDHPIHLHGMWMQLENGAEKLPFKHTITVKPGEKLSVLITPVERGDWAFHCHFLYHMEAGMFQVIRVA